VGAVNASRDGKQLLSPIYYRYRLGRAGWTASESYAVRDEALVWLVLAVKGDRVVSAQSATREETWAKAMRHAEALDTPTRRAVAATMQVADVAGSDGLW
jgi:hypothetical protein